MIGSVVPSASASASSSSSSSSIRPIGTLDPSSFAYLAPEAMWNQILDPSATSSTSSMRHSTSSVSLSNAPSSGSALNVSAIQSSQGLSSAAAEAPSTTDTSNFDYPIPSCCEMTFSSYNELMQHLQISHAHEYLSFDDPAQNHSILSYLAQSLGTSVDDKLLGTSISDKMMLGTSVSDRMLGTSLSEFQHPVALGATIPIYNRDSANAQARAFVPDGLYGALGANAFDPMASTPTSQGQAKRSLTTAAFSIGSYNSQFDLKRFREGIPSPMMPSDFGGMVPGFDPPAMADPSQLPQSNATVVPDLQSHDSPHTRTFAHPISRASHAGHHVKRHGRSQSQKYEHPASETQLASKPNRASLSHPDAAREALAAQLAAQPPGLAQTASLPGQILPFSLSTSTIFPQASQTQHVAQLSTPSPLLSQQRSFSQPGRDPGTIYYKPTSQLTKGLAPEMMSAAQSTPQAMIPTPALSQNPMPPPADASIFRMFTGGIPTAAAPSMLANNAQGPMHPDPLLQLNGTQIDAKSGSIAGLYPGIPARMGPVNGASQADQATQGAQIFDGGFVNPSGLLHAAGIPIHRPVSSSSHRTELDDIIQSLETSTSLKSPPILPIVATDAYMEKFSLLDPSLSQSAAMDLVPDSQNLTNATGGAHVLVPPLPGVGVSYLAPDINPYFTRSGTPMSQFSPQPSPKASPRVSHASSVSAPASNSPSSSPALSSVSAPATPHSIAGLMSGPAVPSGPSGGLGSGSGTGSGSGAGMKKSKAASSSADPPVSKPYKCLFPNCTKSYKNANGLKYHIEYGHMDEDGTQSDGSEKRQRRYKCRFGGIECHKQYKNLGGLRYHFIHHHPEVDWKEELKSIKEERDGPAAAVASAASASAAAAAGHTIDNNFDDLSAAQLEQLMYSLESADMSSMGVGGLDHYGDIANDYLQYPQNETGHPNAEADGRFFSSS
ncbi:uncharacterized protein BJ171DRAFT_524271 [Polychytrium aggregatum]|uniref:uncharacterized protein n=1 Tax=Polychytrium aggregatum TaxID=110093 RepID=UPI0022FE8C02|nr:uncharacterized protein BJ171DRAFT_524271 [Polychytrium aggregatum]KAI9193694.1 hypothetical protein BJ171DRAFT_524271 [Polychytrium aggregatum]